MKRVIHARRGGRPPGSRTRAESPGAVKTAMFYIIYLPCLPLSTVIYAPPPARFRIRRGGSIRSRRNGPPLVTRAARRNLRSKGPRIYLGVGTTLLPRPRFCKAGREYVPLSSSEFRGREFLTVSLKPISRDSFPRACAWWSGRGPSGWFRGNDTFFLSFETSFEDFREPLDRSTETRYLSSLARWLLNITNSFPPLCPSTSSKGTNKFPGKKRKSKPWTSMRSGSTKRQFQRRSPK